MQDFLRLQVWRKANAVGFDVHRFATRIRGRDNAALKGQLQRSAPGIADAIAEGAGKASNAEFARYLDIALGSASETHSQLISARQRQLIDDAQFNDLADRVTEVRKMLFGLMKKVRGDNSRPPDAKEGG
jgi:S23 ribosomal protein.